MISAEQFGQPYYFLGRQLAWCVVGLLVMVGLMRIDYRVLRNEQLIFPEVEYDKVVKVLGMDITIVTTAQDDDQARALFRALGFPFRERS